MFIAKIYTQFHQIKDLFKLLRFTCLSFLLWTSVAELDDISGEGEHDDDVNYFGDQESFANEVRTVQQPTMVKRKHTSCSCFHWS